MAFSLFGMFGSFLELAKDALLSRHSGAMWNLVLIYSHDYFCKSTLSIWASSIYSFLGIPGKFLTLLFVGLVLRFAAEKSVFVFVCCYC